MKELTIQQKAEAYDEALKIARNILDSTDDNYVCTHLTKEDIKEMYSRFFPQLKEEESEDEKIKKSLIDYFSDFHLQTFAGIDPKKVLAWIKKQGSDELAWNEEDEKIWKELIEEVKDQLNSVPAPDCRDKEDEKVLKQLTRWLVWLKSIKDRVRSQSKWRPSDEQMTTFWDAICTLNHDGYKWINDMKSLYSDLKKLREE